MSGLSELYRDAILQHASDPQGFGREIEATHRKELFNPLCGDRIEVQLRIVGDAVEKAAFSGEACTICMASASLLCAAVPGNPVADLVEMHNRLRAALEDGGDLNGAEMLEPLLGVRPFPSRIRCATLPWSAALEAL